MRTSYAWLNGLLLAAMVAVIYLAYQQISLLTDNQHSSQTSLEQKLATLDSAAGGRIGIAALDSTNNLSINYRATERFPFCSTSKAMTVAAILQKSMTTPRLLQQRVLYSEQELAASGYSPITKQHLKSGMTIAELCAAAITHSDNTAMNLLITQLGGIDAVNAFAHAIGDHAFRLARLEPALNSAIPGDLRDTTQPAAMAQSLQRLLLGNALAPTQRKLLRSWLINNRTGNLRIRASVPPGWQVGDKTGTGDYGTTNDIAILWPPHCAPLVVAVYFTQNKQDAPPRDDVIAAATRLLLQALAHKDPCLAIAAR